LKFISFNNNFYLQDSKNFAILSSITLAKIVEEKDNDVILADDTIIQRIVHVSIILFINLQK